MIIHQPRLAWDAARVFVTASESEGDFRWLSDRVFGLLGAASQEALAATRHRLARPVRPDARHLETGTWRARIEDALRDRPDLAVPLKALVTEAGARVTRPWPYWPVN
jgi:hypothetical protein